MTTQLDNCSGIVGVIDIGSNSIKSLMARREGHRLRILHKGYRAVRILGDISKEGALGPDLIEAGTRAVESLALEMEPTLIRSQVEIVATSAVRSAPDRNSFNDSLAERGLSLRILSGDHEAQAIATGLIHDLAGRNGLSTFSFFDQGGGSMEIGRVENGILRGCVSLPLGAVRLTREWVPEVDTALPESAELAIRKRVRSALLPHLSWLQSPVVGTGGGMAVARDLLDPAMPRLSRHKLAQLRNFLCQIPLQERKQLKNMAPERADILPAALILFDELMALAGTEELHHSVANLRYGIAVQRLGLTPPAAEASP